jgi:hypothetical protein
LCFQQLHELTVLSQGMAIVDMHDD